MQGFRLGTRSQDQPLLCDVLWSLCLLTDLVFEPHTVGRDEKKRRVCTFHFVKADVLRSMEGWAGGDASRPYPMGRHQELDASWLETREVEMERAYDGQYDDICTVSHRWPTSPVVTFAPLARHHHTHVARHHHTHLNHLTIQSHPHIGIIWSHIGGRTRRTQTRLGLS